MTSISADSQLSSSQFNHSQKWYLPTFSPEHGVYIILIISFLIGVISAQQWTWATTLAFICVFCGFQAERPLVLQIKQRKSWKPRFLLWGSVYGGIAVAIAIWFLWQSQDVLPLLLIYAGVAVALIIDLISVWYRQQKSIPNELVTFTALCLSTPLVYTVTTGTISQLMIALWILNTLFFSTTIFTMKLRKRKTASIIPGLVFHGVATIIVFILGLTGWLTPLTASAFMVALLKFALILWRKNWYCTTKIKQVAIVETVSSLIFSAVVILSICN